MIFIKSLKKIYFELFTICLSILIIIFVYPLLIIFFLPCWIYRCLVTNLVQINPNFGRILKGIDATGAGQNPYSNPECVLLPNFYLTDQLDVAKVVKALNEKVIRPDLYPELGQKIVRKYGYHFWYNINNFKVEDHVRNLNPENPNMPITRTQLKNLANRNLVKLPFNPERSPWELIVVTNYLDDRNPELKSVLMLRVNHCMMDGYSIYTIFMKVSEKPWKWIMAQKQEKPSISAKLVDIYNFVKLLVFGPYHLLKMFVFSNDHHEFVANVFKPDYKDVWNTECTSTVSKDVLTSVQCSYGVSMSALITTLFGQAVYKTMKRANTQKLTKTIHCFLSYPLQGHKDMLTNHWTLVKIPIQVDEKDPGKTLKFVEKEFQSLRKSVKPLVYFYVCKMIAMAPLGLRYSQTKLPPTTFVLTNFPGPSGTNDIFGCQWKKTNLTGKGAGGTAFLLASISTCDEFLFEVESPVCNLKTQEDIDILSDDVLGTLADLESKKLEQTKN